MRISLEILFLEKLVILLIGLIRYVLIHYATIFSSHGVDKHVENDLHFSLDTDYRILNPIILRLLSLESDRLGGFGSPFTWGLRSQLGFLSLLGLSALYIPFFVYVHYSQGL